MPDRRYDTTPKTQVKGHVRQTQKGPTWVRTHVRKIKPRVNKEFAVINRDAKKDKSHEEFSSSYEPLKATVSDIEFEDGMAYFEINVYGGDTAIDDFEERYIFPSIERALNDNFGSDWSHTPEWGENFVRYYIDVEMDVEY